MKLYRNILTTLKNNEVTFPAPHSLILKKEYEYIWNKLENGLTYDKKNYSNKENVFLKYLYAKDMISQHPRKIPVLENEIIQNIQLQITSTCDNKCAHCYVGDKNPCKISMDDIHFLSEEFKTLGVTRVEITGGEPTTHPHFKEIISHFREQGFLLSLFTNGLHVEKYIDTILDTCDWVQLSLDGNKEYHNEFRKNPNSYHNVLKALNLLTSNKNETTCVTIAMSVNHDNLKMVKDIKNFADTHKVEFRFSPAVPSGRNLDQAFDTHLDLIKKIEESQITSELKELKEEHRKYTCAALSRILYIDASLDVYPCPLLSHTKFKIDTINTSQNSDLLRIINSEASKALIERKNSTWKDHSDKLTSFKCPAYYSSIID